MHRIILLFLFALLLMPKAAAAQSSLPSIVIDRATGNVLHENRPFDRWFPASLTKLMTVYVTLRSLSAGEIAPRIAGDCLGPCRKGTAIKMGYAPARVCESNGA